MNPTGLPAAGTAANLPYFYSSMSRSIAEHLLVSTCESLGFEGCYLVRASETKPGAMVLSVGFQGRVHHYRVLFSHDTKTYQMEGHTSAFASLPDLLQNASDTGKLVTTLAYPIIDDAYEEETEQDVVEEVVSKDVELLLQTMQRRGGSEHEFSASLRRYLREDADSDLIQCREGKSPNELHINQLLLEASMQLAAELDTFQRRLMLIRDVFKDAGMAKGLEPLTEAPPELSVATSMDVVQHKLAASAALIADARFQSTEFFQASTSHVNTRSIGLDVPKEVLFEVKRIELMKRVAGFVLVDVATGELRIGDGEFNRASARMFKHDEVIQLIKSRSDRTKLGIKFETMPNKWERKNYAFADARQREHCAQLVQRMKIKHGDGNAELRSKLRVFIGTFNMGDEPPPDDISSWFNCLGMGTVTREHVAYDLYAIGTQEQKCKDEEWHEKIRQTIGPEFEIVAKASLLQIKLVVFVRQSLLNRISHVQTSTAATGIANTIGNKGAAAASMFIGTTSVCFINCHLAASMEKTMRRNDNYRLILQKLQLGDKKLSMFDVTNQFHQVFWFGDLNYRVNLPIQTVLGELDNAEKTGGNLASMHRADQLRQQRKKGEVLYGFHEDEITFKPTYRFKKGTRKEYAYHKKKKGGVTKLNVPSWCDRVLYRSFPNQPIRQLTYGCTMDIVTSDHSPVFAGFELYFSNQYVSKLQGADHQCKIIISDVTATIYTPSKSNLYLEFHSAFFEGKARSPLEPTEDRKPPNECPADTTQQHWDHVVSIRPLIPDQEYLETEALMVVVRSEDTNEAWGEGRFALRAVDGLSADTPKYFSTELSHGGLHTGFLAGKVCIKDAVSSAASMYAVDDEDDETGGEGIEHGLTMDQRPRAEAISPSGSGKVAMVQKEQLSPGTNRVGSARLTTSKMHAWLGGLGLGRLGDKLVEHGYDDVDSFLRGDVAKGDLLEIGISEEDASLLFHTLTSL
eukprot:m.7397 g.7397  ORF g.7397 m.7397 type:complete len:971 (-) comp2443_c0_seq2:390-3302(-)